MRERIKVIIFGTETPAGRLFDLILITSILCSVLLVMLDSVIELREAYGPIFNGAEWAFTILFTIEYFLRVFSIRLPSSYIFSFFGIIDLLSLIPTYLSLILPGAQVFSVIRVLRVLRVFRVFSSTAQTSCFSEISSNFLAGTQLWKKIIVIKNIESIYESNSAFNVLKDLERVLDELDIYVYKNWEDGELAEGPAIDRHGVTAKFMWPHDKMPDPEGGKRLLDYACKIGYEK